MTRKAPEETGRRSIRLKGYDYSQAGAVLRHHRFLRPGEFVWGGCRKQDGFKSIRSDCKSAMGKINPPISAG